MTSIRILIHAPGAPGLRLFGLGPGFRPSRGLWKLQRLLNDHTSWAQERSLGQLRRMLAGSSAIVTLWNGRRLVGFGRACSDGVFRCVLWDVVIPRDLRGQGLGRKLVEALLTSPAVSSVERTYLMTTDGTGFYQKLGFDRVNNQKLMLLQ